MPFTLNPPPPTPVEPVIEMLHGVLIADPYRWLEDQNSPRTRKWHEEQTTYTRTHLDAIPSRSRIRKRVEELLAVEVISEPWKVGNRYFYLKRRSDQEQPVIMMREGEVGEEAVLVDPVRTGRDKSAALSILNISDNGRVLACGVKYSGSDMQSVEFVDVTQRKVLRDHLPEGFGPSLLFSADGQGFYYSHEIVNASRPHHRAVYWHKFGAEAGDDVQVFLTGEDRQLNVGVIGSPSGRRLAYVVIHSGDRLTYDLYIQEMFEKKPARKIVDRMESVFVPFFIGDRLFALTDWKAVNLRIVEIDLESPERAHWRTAVPESAARMKDLSIVANFICVGYVENSGNRMKVFDSSGKVLGKVPCPHHGTFRLFWRPVKNDTLFYSFSSFDQPPTIYSYDPISGDQRIWSKTEVVLHPSSIEVEQIRYESKDGTEIPMLLVAQKGRRLSGALPVFLTGYGGFGVSLTHQFNVYSTFLIEQGFLLAIANVRGGGELGVEWHRAGKRHNRQNAIDDFICAAEWLLSKGHAVPGKIAMGGGSNAGLLVAAVLTQRPDLFAAVVCLGPLLDMLRYHLFDSAERWIEEYGCSENQQDFNHLLAYSPYHRVDQAAYPAVLFVSGDADTRCNPMHVRKMTARLQAATSSGRPILLDYRSTWGHASTQPLKRRIEALTDRLAFICSELSVNV
jgi:prolyl oligopeptidase